jgi:tetratricopeptide (TPR) repeat protein
MFVLMITAAVNLELTIFTGEASSSLINATNSKRGATVGSRSNGVGDLRGGAIAQRIIALEAAVAKDPKAGPQWLELGSTYLRRAFETGDPSYYPLAERSLGRAKKILHSTPEVLGAQASLALARHQFFEARALSAQLLAQRPLSVEGQIARFDAIIELGSYTEAFRLIEELVDQKAGLSTLARLSYIQQLLGDRVGAELSMRAAVGAAPEDSFDRAVALGYLGDLLMENGKLDAASRTYLRALMIAPELSIALLGQARVAMAKGKPVDAVTIVNRVTERNPTPGGLGFRADIARSIGDTKAMIEADQLVDASVLLFRASGSVVDAELAVLLADRGPSGAKKALATATTAYKERQTIFTADALAWALFASGKMAEAKIYATQAIRTDPAVSSVRWHAAAIFAATGDNSAARKELLAAQRNPWFSPSQRPAMAALAKKLGMAVQVSLSSPVIAANIVPTIKETT